MVILGVEFEGGFNMIFGFIIIIVWGREWFSVFYWLLNVIFNIWVFVVVIICILWIRSDREEEYLIVERWREW